jgi:(1->4)-alpha-D-glucan 1-alpha-D-glucosylmutase
LTHKLLQIRNAHAGLFRDGSYDAVHVEGTHASHVVGFARTKDSERIAVLAGRHFATLTNGGRTWPQDWSGHLGISGQARVFDLLRDGPLADDTTLRTLFSDIPVAVLKIQR